jgi:hypothetical protein
MPLPPQNVEVLSPFTPGMLDIRWDNPALLGKNSTYNIVGVNIYRSDVSDLGPFFRINDFPLGGTFYRDQTTNVLIGAETVDWNSAWLFKGDAPNDPRWSFRTQFPIVKVTDAAPFAQPTYANAPSDVTVTIDGEVVKVDSVFGPTGEVTLITHDNIDVGTEKCVQPTLPGPDSVVTIAYYANRNHILSGLDSRVWYRLTTVVLDPDTQSGLNETPLDYCQPHSLIEVERLDYIWRRAIRMNHWILQQGGERVKIFIRRQTGIPCPCTIEARTRAFAKQPSNRCDICFGTGFCGGYEGPFDVIVAPDDAERRISQKHYGRHKEHSYEVWMGPSPVLTQRDFIVKQTNERYSVGAVRRPSNRGTLLQQHFNISYLDEGDIRYRMPIDGVVDYTYPETRYAQVYAPSLPVDGDFPNTVYPWTGDPPFERGARNVNPMITEKDNTPDEVEQRGRTPVWENINY